jgi:hypothetical protein
MNQTIKDFIFEYISENEGNVNFEKLSNLIFKIFPNSQWKKTHWAWYKTQIVSPKGKYYNIFTDSIKNNLSKRNYSNLNLNVNNKMKNNDLFEFPDYSSTVEIDIAVALGKVCHHIHPDIVNKITQENINFKKEFQQVCGKLNSDIYFYEGSDCVFPGVRRCINKEKVVKWKNNINPDDYTILNDNTFPRHIWAFLSMNKPYEGNMWKKSGLDKFELAHIFGHKTDEKELEKRVFSKYDKNKLPYALFTSASNIVLIPNGLMKPTDKFESIKIAFYKRHIDLYGNNLYAEKGFDESKTPDWYEDIKWLEPIRPEDWLTRIENLLEYRKRILNKKYKNANC